MKKNQVPSPDSDSVSIRLGRIANEFKVISLRECCLEDDLAVCDNPENSARYWHQHIATSPQHDGETEHLYCLILNTRYRPKGHHLLSKGTLDTCLVHPREVFRVAVISGASAVILFHNHPSGDPTPSESDIKATREIIKAGEIMKINVLDHVIIGRITKAHPRGFYSLRELGYFWGDAAANKSQPECRKPKNKSKPPQAVIDSKAFLKRRLN